MKKVNKIKSSKEAGHSQKKGGKQLKESVSRGINKQYLKSGSLCNVTFRLPKEAAPDAQAVTIVGDFNNWNEKETSMKKLKSGDFKLILKLPCHREYRFRYLIDSDHWENDWYADKYVTNAYGCDDSVVVT